ncbi:MAG TPA: ABC transporter ATP-binding protein [Mobilitalea sp.]|nr:ABC transporter ATP-binding protein [Mobilitalea sp.]
MNGIELKNLTKHYGNLCALEQVNLTLEENKIYGLLGRNGAGKTTLLNIITNRIFADDGEATVDGETVVNNDKALGKIYMLSEKLYYPERMKINNIFQWTKSFYPDFDKAYAIRLCEMFELNPNKTLRSLSTGYLTIFKLIIALSVNVPYLLLDEPVLGLDAYHRDLFYRILLEKFSEKPCTIVISTHLIEEVSGIIEEVIIMKQGKLIHKEACEELLSKGYTISGKAADVDAFIADRRVIGVDTLGGLKVAYLLGKPDSNISKDLEISHLDLQKLFIQLTN